MIVTFVQPLLVGSQRQGLADDLIHVHHRARRMTLPREREQVADDARGALGFGEDRLEPSPGLIVGRMLGQTFGPRQDRRERIVQFVSDARNRLTERGKLLRLEQLMIEIPCLILETLALADVPHQRLHAKGVPFVLGMCRDFRPHRRAVGPPEPEEVIGERLVAREPVGEGTSGLNVHELVLVEGAHVLDGCFTGISEHQLEVRIREQRFGAVAAEEADIDPFVDRFEEPGKFPSFDGHGWLDDR